MCVCVWGGGGRGGSVLFALDVFVDPLHSFFFNKNKLNKNIEAEIARKIRTI